MKISVLPTASLVAVLAVSGCAAPPANTACTSANRQITLGTLFSNSLSGTYDACLTELRGELASLQLSNRQLETNAANLNRQAAAASGEASAAARRLADLNAEQARIGRQISGADATRQVSQGDIENLLAEERAVRQRIDVLNTTGGASAAQAGDVRDRQAELQERLNRL